MAIAVCPGDGEVLVTGSEFPLGYVWMALTMIKKRIHLATFMVALLSTVPQLAGAGYEEGEAANRAGDREAAFSAFHQAAQQGDARAFGKLGAMYLYGLGTSRDYTNAYLWFSLAEKQGDRLAERYRMAASSAMTHTQVRQAQRLVEEKLKELEIMQLPPIK